MYLLNVTQGKFFFRDHYTLFAGQARPTVEVSNHIIENAMQHAVLHRSNAYKAAVMTYSRGEKEWIVLEDKKVRGFLNTHHYKAENDETVELLDTMRCMVYLEGDVEKADEVIENKA